MSLPVEMQNRVREIAQESHHAYSEWQINLDKYTQLVVREVLLKINGAKIRGESLESLVGGIKADFGIEE